MYDAPNKPKIMFFYLNFHKIHIFLQFFKNQIFGLGSNDPHMNRLIQDDLDSGSGPDDQGHRSELLNHAFNAPTWVRWGCIQGLIISQEFKANVI